MTLTFQARVQSPRQSDTVHVESYSKVLLNGHHYGFCLYLGTFANPRDTLYILFVCTFPRKLIKIS